MSATETIYGTPVVNGLAYGPVAWVSRFKIPELPATKIPLAERKAEVERYLQAAQTVSERLLTRAKDTIGTASDILAAQAELSRDPGFKKMVVQAINEGTPAASAVMTTTDTFCRMFEQAGRLMAERTIDLNDLCLRVVAEL